MDIGEIQELRSLQRGPSGRIIRLLLRGSLRSMEVGKELMIRKILSRSHLYSSAFDAEISGGKVILSGHGWGHGVGLCQIGAAVMASRGKSYSEILSFYYPGTIVENDWNI